MKIISTKEYNELKKTQSAYLDLLMKPLQGVFEKVTDDDLLRDNANLYAENKKLHSIIKEAREYINNSGGVELVNSYSFPEKPIIDKLAKNDLLKILDKENNNENN